MQHRRRNALPQPQIHTPIGRSNHPAQPHVEPLGSRAFRRIGDVLLGTESHALLGHKCAMKGSQCRRQARGIFRRLPPRHHGLLQRSMGPKQPRQRLHKSLGIHFLEGAVHKPLKHLQIRFLVVHDKTPRCVVHALHQTLQAFQYGHAVSPGQGCREKRGHFNVSPVGETMWYGQGVLRDEIRHFIPLRLFEQKLLHFLRCHAAKIGLNSHCVGKA